MRAAAGLLGLALSACSSAPEYPTRPAPAAPTPTPSIQPAPPPALAPPRSPIPRPQASADDKCGAAQMQGMIGHPRTLIPVPIDPNHQRVACTTCPVTQDFDPARLNFFFDAETGLIRQVRCG